MPSDGSLALPEDVVMEPLSLEGLLNTNLDIQVFTLTRGQGDTHSRYQLVIKETAIGKIVSSFRFNLP